VAEAVEHLPSKCEALKSNSSTTKRKEMAPVLMDAQSLMRMDKRKQYIFFFRIQTG
jgi:hypothetical protein